jgi:hypothetical protein
MKRRSFIAGISAAIAYVSIRSIPEEPKASGGFVGEDHQYLVGERPIELMIPKPEKVGCLRCGFKHVDAHGLDTWTRRPHKCRQ